VQTEIRALQESIERLAGVNKDLGKKVEEREEVIEGLKQEVKEKEREVEETREALREVGNASGLRM
jgi:peptidoglycan hydrolase CwlO-like protein